MKESQETKIALIKQSVDYIKAEVIEIKELLLNSYVTKERHESDLENIRNEIRPVKTIAFGLMGLLGTTVGTAIIMSQFLK